MYVCYSHLILCSTALLLSGIISLNRLRLSHAEPPIATYVTHSFF
jgi:hypothetical protein